MTISDLRHRIGLSQSKFVDKFYISVRTLQRWEQGETDTSEHIIFMIRLILDLKDIVNGKQSN